MSAAIAGFEPTDAVGTAEHVRRVDGARGECFRGLMRICVQASAHTTGRLSQKALPGLKSVASATMAPASIERARGRHRAAEEERRDREQHGGDIGPRKVARAFFAGRLEVVDAHARRGRSRAATPPPS